MKHELEALLFATDAPLTISRLKSIFPGTSSKELRQTIADLNEDYDQQERAFTIVEFGGGWQIASRPQFAPLINKLFRGRRFTRLSKAGLEVLAIIAYRQPITRMEIEDVRGVQCSGVLTTLAERHLITVVGRSETVGHPLLYGTTREFLNHLGLNTLHQLPSLPDIEGIINNRADLRLFANQLGEELSDSDLAILSSGQGEDDKAEPASEDPTRQSDVKPIQPDSEQYGERVEG